MIDPEPAVADPVVPTGPLYAFRPGQRVGHQVLCLFIDGHLYSPGVVATPALVPGATVFLKMLTADGGFVAGRSWRTRYFFPEARVVRGRRGPFVVDRIDPTAVVGMVQAGAAYLLTKSESTP